MKIAQGLTPIELLSAVLVEGARAVGTPMRATCLFSNSAVAIVEVDAELTPRVIYELPGGERGYVLPAIISMAGSGRMVSGTITPENPEHFTVN